MKLLDRLRSRDRDDSQRRRLERQQQLTEELQALRVFTFEDQTAGAASQPGASRR